MASRRKVRDNRLLDALEGVPAVLFDDPVWRVVRAGRDPLIGSASGGRWDDGSFEVLYTSAERDGALAEMDFHIRRGQPVFPSRMVFRLYRLAVSLRRALRLADMTALQGLGVDPDSYGTLPHGRNREEYAHSQAIAEAAHFLNFDGLVVPNARWSCINVVIFSDRVVPQDLSIAQDHGAVDWTAWAKQTKEA